MTQYELVGKIMSLGSQNKGANPEAKMKAKDQGVVLLNEYLQSKAENLPISGVSVSDSRIEELFPFEDENNATPTKPAERIAAYNSRQADRREGARRLLGLLHSR